MHDLYTIDGLMLSSFSFESKYISAINYFVLLVGFLKKLIKIEMVISQVEASGHVAVTHCTDTSTLRRHYKQKQALWEHDSYTIQLLSVSWGVCYGSICVHGYINYLHYIQQTIWDGIICVICSGVITDTLTYINEHHTTQMDSWGDQQGVITVVCQYHVHPVKCGCRL